MMTTKADDDIEKGDDREEVGGELDDIEEEDGDPVKERMKMTMT